MRTDFPGGVGGSAIFGFMPALRIAIPSWRFVGIGRAPEPEREPRTVSREEIAALFHGDLNPPARAASVRSENDAREKAIASRIRQALYS